MIFIIVLLNNVGTHINPCNLVKRIESGLKPVSVVALPQGPSHNQGTC